MLSWPEDPFTRYLDDNGRTVGTSSYDGGPSELALWQISCLNLLARSEGLEPIRTRDSRAFEYLPEKAVIEINQNLPWPDFRWCLAVALGLHFTRGEYYGGEGARSWHEQARAWASSYLASSAHEAASRAHDWPSLRDNTKPPSNGLPCLRCNERDRLKVKDPWCPECMAEEKAQAKARRTACSCRASTAAGTLCKRKAVPGEAFCQQHANHGFKLESLLKTLPR